MNLDVITESLTNEEIALRQLERAITLFLNEKDFVSSITLAGAAEEILGNLLKIDDKSHVLEQLIEGALHLNKIHPESAQAPKARKEIANIANYYRNRMKHYNDEASITLSTDYFAADIIDRALSNYWALTKTETDLMRRFRLEILGSGEQNA